MEIITLTDKNVLSSNTYIIISGDTFSVVDPSVSFEKAKAAYPALDKKTCGYVLLTHGHADHIRQVQSYVDAGCEVLITEQDALLASNIEWNCTLILGEKTAYSGNYRKIVDGEVINVGDESITVITTPGHTAGSVSYLSGSVIFTGDTLFAGGGYGRYDLVSSSFYQLRESLEKLFVLDGDLVIYPGHGPISTLRETKNILQEKQKGILKWKN